jgi:hypothetical protein
MEVSHDESQVPGDRNSDSHRERFRPHISVFQGVSSGAGEAGMQFQVRRTLGPRFTALATNTRMLQEM